MTEQEKRTITEAREILLRHFNRNPVLASWQAVLDYCSLTVRGERERLHVLFLDRKNRLIADETVSVGTVDHVPCYPREVVRRALLLNATAILICHNHPAGDPEPSEADIAMTKKVRKACQALDITLHDHIIVGAGFEVSLRARGVI
ncbi:RadC family protein [Paenirhodobacter populi]|uniref:DNA repair protein RadC n=1 Tax=Paenirhodobacter populi TaxID=2306993 RepID=A0A443JRF4_9RHOB|nr:DNA repair protein RadC [Sinirhodobacter populi]RWR23077.1 DNA repair protein RadC [Sinirhodobacter populi]